MIVSPRVTVIDSHTGGEPTRVVIEGAPDLGGGTVADQLTVFRQHHDDFRRAVILEPRGSDVLVGALLVEPADRSCAAGVIFFDNVTCLGMCGHGTIGVIKTLAHLGRIGIGEHRIETPVGVISGQLHHDGSISVVNIPSRRTAKAVSIEVPGHGRVVGDVAYGGNWFFLIDAHPFALETREIPQLSDFAWNVRLAANAQGFPEVDHIILHRPLTSSAAHSRNFVLCPGRAYDRSPCGTGTSARLASLAADGLLAENELLVQESIIGSRFTARYRWLDRSAGLIEPTIAGTAHLTSEATLFFDPTDPFRHGIS